MSQVARPDAPPVVVRAAAAGDRGFVVATAERLAGFEPPPPRTREQIVAVDRTKLDSFFSPGRRLRRELGAALGRRPGTSLLVAERAGEPLGFAYLCHERDYFTGAGEAYLDVIAVSSAGAGSGVGSALLQAAERWARERGHATIALNVFAVNRRARLVYEHFGYVVDTVHYVKELSRPAAPGLSARPAEEQPAGEPPAGAVQRRREWFDDDGFWQELYPCVFTERRFAAAAGEVERLLALAAPELAPGGAVLDLACGPGRTAVELARRGLQVTAVDRTRPLLDEGRRRAEQAGVRVEWVCADMRDFARPGAFAVALCLFTSFGYFEDPDDDLLVLERVRHSLAPGAPLVIDVVGKECFAQLYQPQTEETLADGTRILKRHEVRRDWTRLHEEWTVTRGEAERRFRFEHTLYSGGELRERMERAGFTGVRLYGGHGGEPYGPEAASLVAIGRRPA